MGDTGPRPDHRFLTIRVRDHTCAERLLEVKGEWMLATTGFVVGSIYAKRCVCIHGRILRYTKYGH